MTPKIWFPLTHLFALAVTLAPGLLPAQTFLDPSRAASNTSSTVAPQVRESSTEPLAELEEDNTFAPISPGDNDIGQQLILKRQEKARSFSAWVDSSMFWTDNAANVDIGKFDDWFYNGGVNLAWQKRLHSRFYADAYIGQHWYLYDEFDVLDYQVGDATLGTLIILPELANTILHAHYQYQRITQNIDDDAIYETHNLRIGAQKTFLIDRLNSFNTNILAVFALDTDPDLLQRHEYAAQAAYSFKITRRLIFTLAGRVAYYDYFNLDGRQDWFQTYSASLTWRPKEYLELSAHYNYAINRSSRDVFDYETQIAGPSIALKFRF
ncbi:TonB-dependent receptor [Phragmitibacter flavus]|nr:TonB-dependent receptor [Phragmitibacter flavus]